MSKISAAGKYKARVQESNTYITQAKSGNFQIALPLEVSDGAHSGATITWWKAITENTIDDLAERLAEAFGYEGGLHDLYDGNCPFVGAECSITVKQDGTDEQGNPRFVVDWLNAVGGGFKKPEQGEFNSFMNRFGGRFAAIAKNKLNQTGREPVKAPPATAPAPSATRPAPSPAATGTEDDLPF